MDKQTVLVEYLDIRQWLAEDLLCLRLCNAIDFKMKLSASKPLVQRHNRSSCGGKAVSLAPIKPLVVSRVPS